MPGHSRPRSFPTTFLRPRSSGGVSRNSNPVSCSTKSARSIFYWHHRNARTIVVLAERGRVTKRAGRPRFKVVNYARVMRPRWIVIENVIHMRPWSGYPGLLQTLRDEGYGVAEHVLDAADHGVPQRRKRLFLLCDRECEPPSCITKRHGPKRSTASVLDRPGTWNRSPLDNGRRAAATLERAERGFAVLGRDTPFLIVYYGSDGAGGWQPLTVPPPHDHDA